MNWLWLANVVFLCVSIVQPRDFKIAWMAPKKEYHRVNAASSVGGLKLALQKMQTILSVNHTVRYVLKLYNMECVFGHYETFAGCGSVGLFIHVFLFVELHIYTYLHT